MSFMKSLKGLTSEFKDMLGDKDKKKDEQKLSQSHGPTESDRGASDSYYQHQQPQVHDQSQHSQPPYTSGLPPSGGNFGAPPSGPQLPPGWMQQWDQNSQRYYYLEQATGRTQWEPPVSHDQNRGYGAPPPGPPGSGHYGGGYPQQGHGFPGQQQAYGYGHPPAGAAHSSGKGGMIAAGAGGLVAGGLLGAAVAHDSDSDDGHRHAAPASYGHGGYGSSSGHGYGGSHSQAGHGYGGSHSQAGHGYGGDPGHGGGYGAPPPQSDAEALEHNSNVSGSQRESLEEAREDYEEAQAEARDSDASSSDREEAAEAREDYEEEIEEAEEEAYDD